MIGITQGKERCSTVISPSEGLAFLCKACDKPPVIGSKTQEHAELGDVAQGQPLDTDDMTQEGDLPV